MIILLVTSKTMDMEPVENLTLPTTTRPEFQKEAYQLNRQLQTLDQEALKKMMKISDSLANQTAQRIGDFSLRPTPKKLQPAILAFTGDVYEGLGARSLASKDFSFAQSHLRILSGLYGVLRPLDAIQAYRLEPGYRWLPEDSISTLTQFWKPKITRALEDAITQLPRASRMIVDLASKEFTDMINFQALGVPVIQPKFQDEKAGKLKTITLYTKKARGRMAGWMIRNRIQDAEGAKQFSEDGYGFDPIRSTETEWLFWRKSPKS